MTVSPDKSTCSMGLVLHASHEHMRKVALGVVEYHRANPSVQIVGDGFRPLIPWGRLDEFEGDGLIAIANSVEELEQLKQRGLPFVLTGGRFSDDQYSSVCSDNFAIGQMAAEHLVACGIRKFKFFGSVQWQDEQLRLEGFQAKLAESGHDCELNEISGVDFPFQDEATLQPGLVEKIVAGLDFKASPIGVFCPSAFIGRATIFACRAKGFRVPDDIAVIGVNDDPILCETAEPPLSTIVQASQDIGFHAAKLLANQILEGESPKQVLVPPQRLSIRRSTDMFVVGNANVESALRFMRDHAQDESVDIGDIAKFVGVSRRTLELRFRETMESTPRQELLRMRLEIAKSLLGESNIPITEIAMRSGFGSSQVFSSVFKKELDMTPSQFRLKIHTVSDA